MRRIIALLFALGMIFGLAACGQTSTQRESTPVEESGTPSFEASVSPEESGSPQESAAPAGPRALVVYFSCTGNTEGVAGYIADALAAVSYEIVPEEPYTDADLNYNDSSTRATVEQRDAAVRPAISGLVENMEDYDVIFLGYPIWWGQAPKIIYTFLEGYDFSGKTIVPFCTSGSSGVGSSAANLHSSAPDANWLDGTRFSAGASQSDIQEWINSLGLNISVS